MDLTKDCQHFAHVVAEKVVGEGTIFYRTPYLPFGVRLQVLAANPADPNIDQLWMLCGPNPGSFLNAPGVEQLNYAETKQLLQQWLPGAFMPF